ncbi:MAG TPA: YbaN family protein [Fimbriimonadaceae bacterium]|nr:YbaN family protein [Fimbriimonadaceae bacterium]
MREERTPLARTAYTALGGVCVALGIVGYVLPVMPGTVFLVVALWAFSRGNPRLEMWLLNHRQFGPTLRDWREDGSIRLRTKVVALVMVWVCIPLSCLAIGSWEMRGLVIGLGLVGTWYLLTRKTKIEARPARIEALER